MKYRIHAYPTQDYISDGSHYDTSADTLAEAKSRARYCLTEEFRLSSEASRRLGYAQVLNQAGECVYDCFLK